MRRDEIPIGSILFFIGLGILIGGGLQKSLWIMLFSWVFFGAYFVYIFLNPKVALVGYSIGSLKGEK